MGFSRYRAAQEAARYEQGLKLDKQTVFFLPRFVSDASSLILTNFSICEKVTPSPESFRGRGESAANHDECVL